MAATVVLFKYYAATPTVDSGGGTGVTNMHWLSADTDSSALPLNNPLTRPAAAGSSTFSYENWHKLYVTAMGGSTKINNFKVYMSAGVVNQSGVWAHNVNSNIMSGMQSIRSAYTAAATVSGGTAICSGSVQAAAPGSANLGISGALSTTTQFLAKAHDATDFIVTQFGINKLVNIGQTETKTFTFTYDEQ